MNERNERSQVRSVLSAAANKFFEAFVMADTNASAEEMNRFMSYTAGFWMMDGGYVGEYHAPIKQNREGRGG